MTPEKYRDRLLRAAMRLVDQNRQRPSDNIVGDLDYLETVDAVLAEREAAYEAMQQERDEAREALWTLTDAIEAMGQIAAAFKHARAALSASSTPDKTQTNTTKIQVY